jgi:hypothetical protein
MVNFEKKMLQWSINKWAKYYIDYGKLKEILSEDGSLPLISLWKIWGPFGTGGFITGSRKSNSSGKKSDLTPNEQVSSVQKSSLHDTMQDALIRNEDNGGLRGSSSGHNHDDGEFDEEEEDDEFGRRQSVEYELVRKEIMSMFYQEGDENKHYNETVQSAIAKNFRFRQEIQRQVLKAHDFYNRKYDRLKAEFDLLYDQGMKVLNSEGEDGGAGDYVDVSNGMVFRDSGNIGVEIGTGGSMHSNRSGSSGKSPSSLTQRQNLLPSTSDTTINSVVSLHQLKKTKAPKRNENEVKSSERALIDLHLRICQLETFAIINHTCIMKIIKKHDKVLITRNTLAVQVQQQPSSPTTASATSSNLDDEKDDGFLSDDQRASTTLLLNHLNISPLSTPSTFERMNKHIAFVNPTALFELKKENESLFAKLFCDNSLELAKAELFMKRKTHGGGLAFSFPFRFGCRVGALIILLVWVLWDVVIDYAILKPSEQSEQFEQCHHTNGLEKTNNSIVVLWFNKDFPVYRGLISLCLALWMWGGLLRLWNILRINYLFMLELDPAITASASETLWVAADISIVVLWSFNIHFKVLRCDFPKWPPHGSLGIWALVPIAFMSYKALFPWRERKQMWFSIRDVLIAPFVTVTFCMNYTGDVLTSLVKPFVDLSYMFCFYLSGDWLLSLGQDGYCTKSGTFYTSVVTPVILLGPYWYTYIEEKKSIPIHNN